MIDEKLSRRQLLKGALVGIAAVPAATLIAPRARADEALAESDPAAKQVGYAANAATVNPKLNPTYKPGQTCSNCLQFTGKAGAGVGGCNIFPNKTVKATGWCRVWVGRPA